ncbi:CRE-SPP-20 protein [Caenorhabditis remanei]|uniref:CRE-SPP-20 protein n=1 Tax=Caenorhabditis remanei TaxID=31234 RepID=E3LUV4_CAERE|nr:CRE-SPP-20 protein [Caenorhabditis remanei]
MKLIFSFLLLASLLVICSAQTAQPPSNCKTFCNLCQEGFKLIQKNIALVESITNDQLVKMLDYVCNKAPQLDIIKLVCDVAKNDVIDGINKFLEFIKNNTDPSTTCHQLSIC